MSPIRPVRPGIADGQAGTPEKVLDAAQQFEALLLSQILRAAREAGGGWMGSRDASSDCATEYAEQQFAAVMARSGGLGIASLVVKGLEPKN